MVQRREGSRHVKGRVVRGRVRGAQTYGSRDAGDDAEHDAEVELHRAGNKTHRVSHRPAIDAGHGKTVVEKHQVEAALLQGSPQLLVVAGREEAVLGGRMSPGPGVDGSAPGLHK